MSVTILTEARRRARKRHACHLCLMPIEAGEMYRYYTYAAEGSMWTNREHEDCAEIVWHEWQMDEGPIDPQELRAELAERHGVFTEHHDVEVKR